MPDRVLVLLAVVLVTLGAGAWWRSRQGRVRVSRTADDAVAGAPGPDAALVWRERGVVLGDRATFVQFSAAVCSPCRHTARVLGGLTGERDDVRHVELDVDEHPALVRELSVLRTPTVVVLGPDGSEVARMSGAVNRRQAEEALDVVAHAA